MSIVTIFFNATILNIAIILMPICLQSKQIQIVFLLYDGMNALDLVGPHEILCDLPEAKILRVAKQPGPIRTDSGLVLTAEFGLNDISEADVLVVPGASNATTLRNERETLGWIHS